MTIPIISPDDYRCLIIGPIYDKIDKLDSIQQLLLPNDLLIFLGDMCFPTSPPILERIKIFERFRQDKNVFYILGNHDLILKSKVGMVSQQIYNWISDQVMGVKINYSNGSKYLIIHGGLSENQQNIDDDLEISFINSKAFHQKYNGEHGFIISAHPKINNKEVEIYNYSASLETEAFKSNILLIQELTKSGLEKTFLL